MSLVTGPDWPNTSGDFVNRGFSRHANYSMAEYIDEDFAKLQEKKHKRTKSEPSLMHEEENIKTGGPSSFDQSRASSVRPQDKDDS